MTRKTYPLADDLSGYTHLLLYRHGRTGSEPGKSESDRSLSSAGVDAVQQVARRLAEEVTTGKRDFVIATVLHGHYRQVRQTGGLVRQALQAQDEHAWPDDVRATRALDPDFFRAAPGSPEARKLHSDHALGSPSPGVALLVIGHEPQLSDIARGLQRLPRHGRVVTPSAGVACFRLVGQHPWNRPRLEWVIEPTDDDTTELLRKKISSKMDVAKVFGAVITFALGITLNVLLGASTASGLTHRGSVTAAAGALGLALVLYVAVLYAYDSLLMPSRFWGTSNRRKRRGRGVVARPPSSQNLVLQQNMVWIWSWPFTFANILVVFAFGLLAWGAIGIAGGWVVATAALAVALAFWVPRVDLGVQD